MTARHPLERELAEIGDAEASVARALEHLVAVTHDRALNTLPTDDAVRNLRSIAEQLNQHRGWIEASIAKHGSEWFAQGKAYPIPEAGPR